MESEHNKKYCPICNAEMNGIYSFVFERTFWFCPNKINHGQVPIMVGE